MNNQLLRNLLLGTSLVSGLAYAGPAFAQTDNTADADVPQVEVIDEAEEENENFDSEVVVTGSRIKRDTFSSISPLQVLTTDLSQDVGLFDPAAILQRSESAAGQQIDATFQGFVLDNGPGSQTINLRGLGADRTLLLINGRRMAPAGVEGAPTNPSINLLPGSLIDRNELLLDGASSVYGSDAVAGVANIILRKDFEGLEVFGRTSYNEQGGDTDYTLSAAYGKNTDRGFFGIGAEYDFRDEVKLRDREFLEGCDTHYEITSDGQIRTVGLRDNATVGARTPGVSVSESPCKVDGISGRIFIPFTNYGSVYYTDGPGNTGIPGFNESLINGTDVDSNGDGLRDVDFQNVNNNAANLDQTFISEQKLYNVMAYGEYTFEGEANLTPFFEANYSLAKIQSDNTGTPQIFPYVSATNVFNPCFRGTGVDCRAAENANYGTGLGGGFDLPVIPIVTVQGDRNNVAVDQEQIRFVGGVKGDMPFMNFASFSGWTFEAAGVYSKATGSSFRRGIREDKLALSIGIDPTADFNGDGIVDNNGDGIADDYNQNVRIGGIFGGPEIAACDGSALSNPALAMPDLLDGCVAVNLFAPSLLGQTIGDFETAAERDYVFGTRNFDTSYEQILISAFATGDIMEVPAGQIAMVVGAEYREDKINSTPSVEASNGLLFAFASDRGAVGSKHIKEAFAELSIPLVADKPFFRELDLNLSGRITDEEFYGTAGTYAVKGGWRPFDSLLLKASLGTSFRAPNLRENFLAGQTGFRTLVDPCAVPDDAFVNNAYVANLDTREQTTLDNCIREGRDPTQAGIDANNLNTFQTPSVEITSGGSLALDEETSRSMTAGFAFEQPFYDNFDLDLNFNYYDIKINGAVVEPNPQFILNDCYTRQDGVRSQFCDSITVDTLATSRMLVSNINGDFINFDEEVVRGMDFNAVFGKEFTAFDKAIDLDVRFRANRLIERSSLFIGTDGAETFDEDAGEFGFPEWTGRTTFAATVDDFTLTWQVRYIGAVEQQADGIDPLDDAFGNEGTGFFGDTCLGTAAGDVTCRDVGFADDYFTHAASIRYRNDTLTVRVGVSNIFDRNPPLVDSNEVFAVSNTPIGNGYDLDGREFFVSINKAF